MIGKILHKLKDIIGDFLFYAASRPMKTLCFINLLVCTIFVILFSLRAKKINEYKQNIKDKEEIQEYNQLLPYFIYNAIIYIILALYVYFIIFFYHSSNDTFQGILICFGILVVLLFFTGFVWCCVSIKNINNFEGECKNRGIIKENKNNISYLMKDSVTMCVWAVIFYIVVIVYMFFLVNYIVSNEYTYLNKVQWTPLPGT